MSDKSNIEWTDATWNPLRGCTKVSEGCRNCYAAGVAARFSGPGMPYEGLAEMTPHGPNWTGKIKLVPDKLEQPLEWKRPRKIFVNSMSDLFHESVPFDYIDQVFVVMALAKQHTFQILTKRPERMVEWFNRDPADVDDALFPFRAKRWPLPNVWLGVSVENQKAVDERIRHLLQTPAAVRFLSMEPLLGEVNLEFNVQFEHPDNEGYGVDAIKGLDWVIVGGESGPHARPMHPDWARDIRDQCQAAGVPFFFKQWGEWSPIHELRCDEPEIMGKLWYNFDPDTSVCKIGKHNASRLLDGRTWDEFPEVKED